MEQEARPIIIKDSVFQADNVGIHYLPCYINSSGDAPIEQFFTSLIKKEPTGLIGNLHGRELKGEEVKLPDGYKLLALINEEGQRKIKRKEDKMTQWNYANDLKENDKPKQMVSFGQFMDAFHSY